MTVPLDRRCWVEYRPTPRDGPTAQRTEQGCFAQRFYDAAALEERLVSPIGKKPIVVRWWGEKSRGRFRECCERWMRDWHGCTADGPREFSELYREFAFLMISIFAASGATFRGV